MTFTIPFGWWLAPALITLLAFGWALPLRADEHPSGRMFDFVRLIGPLLRLLVAAIAALVAWLVWTLVTGGGHV